MGINTFDFINFIGVRFLTLPRVTRYFPKSTMKRMFASVFVILVSLPIAAFACGGGDCSMDLPPPQVPAPGPVENLLGALADHTGLFAGLALAAIVGFVVSRQRKLLETKSAAPFSSPAS